ncbi:MAG TPA: protein kinase [Kofleriaceae bacterium]|nr:protein kinase [Kofleriaceae bacterium]
MAGGDDDGEQATHVEGRFSRRMTTVKPPPAARLEDRGEIARGGQGVIRKMFDHNLHRYVAQKVMDPELLHHPDQRGRFLDEARITGQLDHPNIVPIYDVVEEEHSTEFVMKLVEGETLSKRLKRRKSADDLPRFLEIFLKVCDAIAFAHSRGVIHRDLKPANIMIGEFGEVYVMDWGCAHILPRKGQLSENTPQRMIVDEPGTVIGTSAYMSPEQAHGRTDEIDERTDVFGLGAVLYEILTGSPPYPGSNDDQQSALARAGKVRPPEEVEKLRTPPPGVSAIAMRALSAKREDRQQTVVALRDEIERFLHRGAFFTPRPFPAGTLIVREGDIADEAYIITSGHCEAFREERGRKLSLRTLGPGEVFGEGALFAREPRNASIVAVDDVTAIVLTQQVLDRELGTDSWLGTFIRALTARYRDLEARDMLTRRVIENGRIAAEIINHISRAGRWVRPGVLGTSWSRVWSALQPVLHITEDQALSIVAGTQDLDYDAPRDEITLALLSMA